MNNGINKLSATARTALQETLFAVGFAIGQVKGFPIDRELLLDHHTFINSFNAYVRSNKNPEAVYDFAMDENEWVSSVVAGVNVLKRYRVLQNGKFRIFRGVEIMEEVYERKNQMFKKDLDLKNLANDKWNPGDIWLARMRSIPQFDSIYEYNNFISVELNNGNLIGVSLKKAYNPQIYYVKKDTDPMLYEYDRVAKPQSPFNTGITIKTTDGKTSINIRSFRTSTNSNVRAELQVRGSQARHGKASLTNTIQKHGIPQTPKNKIENTDLEVLKSMVQKGWKKLGYSYTDKDIDEFWKAKIRKGEVDSMTGFFMSIINSLEIGCYLEANKTKADDIITDIIREASSKSELSSEFLKIM